MRPPSMPDTETATNISASAPRRGRLGCSGTSAIATPPDGTGALRARFVPASATHGRGGARARECTAMETREWTVAGGLIETPDGVLLVRNVRRGGFEDWSTPGGVIDDDDADLL